MEEEQVQQETYVSFHCSSPLQADASADAFDYMQADALADAFDYMPRVSRKCIAVDVLFVHGS